MKQKIRLLTLFLLMFFVFAPTVFAETYNGSCGAGIMWTLDTETGVLHISGEGEMHDFDNVLGTRPSWESQRNKITTVIIEPGITRIGKFSFSGYGKLASVSIPDTVTEIAKGAFKGCSSLQYIDLPNGLSEIADSVFYESGLRSIEIPEGVTYIGGSAFSHCNLLTKVVLPDGLQEIRSLAFYDCGALTEIDIPDTVRYIGANAFQYCDALVNVFLHEGLTTIGAAAFDCCRALQYIVLPDTLETIGRNAFSDCTSLQNIKLPNGLISIGSYAFLETPIKHLIVPESVQAVGDSIVGYCEQFEKIAFLNSQCSIGNGSSLGISGKTIVYVHKDSTAEAMAIQHNFAYKYITDDNLWEDEYPEVVLMNPFTDVSLDDWYTDPVLWAVNDGITNGTTDTTFSPEDICTRAQIVTFLWRSQGSPEPTSTVNPFVDVTEGEHTSWYYKAVLWAVENGITNGRDDTHFAPDEKCLRSEVVMFLWRTAQEPASALTENPFQDTSTDHWFYDPVMWAVGDGITNGVDDTHFGPDEECTRAQIVTFLYRYAA